MSKAEREAAATDKPRREYKRKYKTKEREKGNEN